MSSRLPLVLGLLLTALLVICGVGLAAASPAFASTSPSAKAPQCVALEEAQSEFDQAEKAYEAQKPVVAKLNSTLQKLRAQGAPQGQIAAAQQELSLANDKSYKLFTAMNAASLALDAAGRAAAGYGCGDETPTPIPVPVPKKCADFTTQAAAQAALQADKNLAKTLDSNDNGKACDSKGDPWAPTKTGDGPGPVKPTKPIKQPTPVINQTTVVNIQPTKIVVWGGGRWVVYSDGTAVECGSRGERVQRVDEMDDAVDGGAPSDVDVQSAAYPSGGVAAGDGSSSNDFLLPGLVSLGLLSAAGGGYGLWRRRHSLVG